MTEQNRPRMCLVFAPAIAAVLFRRQFRRWTDAGFNIVSESLDAPKPRDESVICA